MSVEIEKKYLVLDAPTDLLLTNGKEIHQTYLAIGEEEVRVRKIIKDTAESFTMTIKKGNGLTREEIEFSISEATYNQLLQSSTAKPLIKTRHKVVINNQSFDFDIYQNAETLGLKTIEIEFLTEDKAHSFVAPSWFSEEVTSDKQYKNQSLWNSIQ